MRKKLLNNNIIKLLCGEKQFNDEAKKKEQEFKDFNDDLRHDGVDALRARLLAQSFVTGRLFPGCHFRTFRPSKSFAIWKDLRFRRFRKTDPVYI